MSLLWQEQRKTRLLAIAGAVGCLIMVLTSASSGPVITLIGAIGGLFFWRFRRSVRKLFWGFCVMLVVLHLVMKAPVWALLGRATVISGSTGYHRYILVDNFIRRFGEWWLLGTKSTDHWGYDLWDITNGYVDQGVNGGLVTFSLFIVVLAFQSRALGAALRLEQLSLSATRRIWAIGCCFFALLLGFFGVTLWGPARVLLYLVFALIAAECGEAAARAEAETLDEGWPNEGAGPSPAVGPEVSS